MAAGSSYTVIPSGVTDLSGNALAAGVTWSIGIFDPTDDTDGDCVSAEIELANGLDPTVDDCAEGLDADGDGISNCDEYDGGTDPRVPDETTPPVLIDPIDDALVDQMLETSWDEIHFSLDAPDPRTNDYLRGRPGVFEQVAKTTSSPWCSLKVAKPDNALFL